VINDREIDGIFERAANAPDAVDPRVLARASASMASSLQPVRPLPPPGRIATWLFLISVSIAIAGASSIGFYGVRKLSVAAIAAIFPALAMFTWFAALLSVSTMTPGGFRWKNPALIEPLMAKVWRLLIVIMVLWIGLDAVLFRDYGFDGFVQQGIPCLRAGLIVAAPAGIASWLVLRHGFAVNSQAAGFSAGMLAGLAGVMMLELHCPNFLAPHIMVWHTAVIPVSALAGSVLAAMFGRRERIAARSN
jgi:hypothetical protein